jgi:hypothetical protein
MDDPGQYCTGTPRRIASGDHHIRRREDQQDVQRGQRGSLPRHGLFIFVSALVLIFTTGYGRGVVGAERCAGARQR